MSRKVNCGALGCSVLPLRRDAGATTTSSNGRIMVAAEVVIGLS
jgi:hypothetical protein